MSLVGEWVLHKLCRPLPPDTNPLTVPSAAQQWGRFQGKFGSPILPYFAGFTLEIGSGHGKLTEGVRNAGAGSIVGLDHWELFPAMVNRNVGDRSRIDFVRGDAMRLPLADEVCDTIISEDAFEHFKYPEKVMAEIFRVLKKDGVLLVTFGPPWFSPRGGHMMFLNPPPWFHLIFSERTIFNVRARYRSDGLRGWSEGYCGLNKMSVADFRRLAHEAGFDPLKETLHPVRGIKALTCLPMLNEFFCSLYAGVWRK